MKLVKTEDLVDGLKVEKDVSDPKGNLLFKAGTMLTQAIIERLKGRMVPHVYVEGSAAVAGLSEEDIKKKLEEIDVELAGVFADCADSPLMMALRESASRHLKSKVQ